MLTVIRSGIILSKTENSFENKGVLNPAVIEENGVIYLFYRAMNEELVSTIGYCELDAPTHVKFRSKQPFIKPEKRYESMGMEDPRIVKIDGTYFFSYTAFDGKNALGALMTGSQLTHLQRHGIIVPLIPVHSFPTEKRSANFIHKESIPKSYFIWDKNLVFFPKRIQGYLCFFHRIKPHISMVRVKELSELDSAFWDEHLSHESEHILSCPSMINSSAAYFGAGCPPIETPEGWLFIYHAGYKENDVMIYRIHLLLLDLENPLLVIAELPYPLLEPETSYEKVGNVNNVVFPTGAILREDTLYLYYGAADLCIACAYFSIQELHKELIHLSN